MDTVHDPVREFRASVTRVTAVSIATLVALMLASTFLPSAPPIIPMPYRALLAGAAIAMHLGVAALPWNRILAGPRGDAALIAYEVGMVTLTSTAIAATDPPQTEMFWLFTLTTTFVAAVLPWRVQLSAFLLTILAYRIALTVSGADAPAFDVVLQVGTLGIVAILTGFIAAAYRRTIRAEKRARRDAQHHATLLRTLADSGGMFHEVDPTMVVEGVAKAALRLGFDTAGVWVDREDGTLERIAGAGHRFPSMPERMDEPSGLIRALRDTGDVVVMRDYANAPGAVEGVRDHFSVGVGVPIRVDRRRAGYLTCGSLEPRDIAAADHEALSLLALQAGRALEIAERYEAEQLLVGELRQLDRMKSDFLSTTSHELRTPLTVVLGLTETMERLWETMPEDRKLDLLARIRANAVALDEVLATLLDFARLEAGTLETKLDTFCLADTIRRTRDRLDPMLTHHPVVIDTPEHAWAHGDARLIERVVENLLTNAARHTPPDTAVRASATITRDGVVVEVADAGPGIPPDQLKRLGERFFRGGDPNTRETRGVGLGLALVREVLRLHQAELAIESELGRGTAFRFTLPTSRGVPVS